jgi:glycosyl transferase family 87
VRALRRGLILLAALAALGAPAAAHAQRVTRAAPAGLAAPPRADRPPPGRRLSAERVLAIASATAAFRSERARHPGAYGRAWLAPRGRWQASLYAPPPAGEVRGREVAQVLVSDATGRVLEAWTGVQVGWTMARGYPGAFGGAVNAPWLWLGLCGAFALPFLRRPWRLLHLDLAVLLAFSGSYAAFNAADLGLSVPSAYPLLGYLLGRMLLLARRRSADLAAGSPRPAPVLPLRLSADGLALGALALFAFRAGLNVTNGNVIDVGYASVVGADRLASGAPLYGAFPPDIAHGDTYGPALYAAYVPFELLFPWHGSWDDLPAAHAAGIAWDAGCALVLWLLGRRLRGPRLGALLAYCWLAFPFTLVVLDSGANDALAGLLVLLALLAVERPAARGALAALAGMAKLAPLALLPLFTGHGRGARPRLVTAAGAAVAILACLVPVAARGELRIAWQQTAGFQADRASPFSLWGAHPGLDAVQVAVQAAGVGLALAVAVWPRRRDAISAAALAAAVLLALQLGVEHWFYAYLAWVLGPVLVAVLAPYAEPAAGRSTGSIEAARRRPAARMSTALSQGSSSAGS